MNKNLLIGLGVLLAVVIAGFYLVGGKSFVGSPKSNYTNPGVSNVSGTPPASVVPSGTVHGVTVTAAEFSYTPSTITVKSGETVKIDFKNVGTVSHNLVIEGLNLSTKTIAPGQEDFLTFTAPKAGTYNFFCSVDSHRDLGLQGTLVVQ